jgi:hypothetical protein
VTGWLVLFSRNKTLQDSIEVGGDGKVPPEPMGREGEGQRCWRGQGRLVRSVPDFSPASGFGEKRMQQTPIFFGQVLIIFGSGSVLFKFL